MCQSTEEFLFQLFGGSIDWKSSKQKSATTSSTEAELLALTHTAEELYAWQRLFGAICYEATSANSADQTGLALCGPLTDVDTR